MNIFILDTDPKLAAKYHCDRHVVKMVLESAQMLSTVLSGPYKPTHRHHPCTKWVSESRDNAEWLCLLMHWLNQEYKERWNKCDDHLAYTKCHHLLEKITQLPNVGQATPFALAMPEQYKTADPVESYRAYYHSKIFASWRNGAPIWWNPSQA